MMEQPQQKTLYVYDGPGADSYTAKIFGAGGGMLLQEKTYKNGRLTQKKTADGTTSKYSYLADSAGKVLAVTVEVKDKDGAKTYLKYDGAGRLISALGKDADKFEKMVKEETDMSEQAFQFGLQKELFGDHRMDSMRLDQKMLQGFGQ